tara:strand:- start:2083 stop:2394 length:312 start_codon:yes stop_codon:yes gene_type:complete
MNNIVKTETVHPIDPKAYPFWLKHYFADGSWICAHKCTDYLAVDFGKDCEIDGSLLKDETDTWDYYYSLVVDLIAGVQRIIIEDVAGETYISIEPGERAYIGS